MPRISIVSIPVSDQTAASKFYQDVLGFRLLSDDPMPNGDHWVHLAPDEDGATITLVTWFEAMPPGSVQGLVFHSDDIEADRARFEQRGLQISKIEDMPWGRFAMFKDPDGNGLVLHGDPVSQA